MDQELADTIAYAPGRRFDDSTFLREMTLWSHLESVTSNRKSDSFSRCVFIEEQSCGISSGSDSKTSLFEEIAPRKAICKISRDMR